MDNNNEQPQINWGDARAQMRITLEIFFTEEGVKLHVKSGEDDILSDNKSAYLIRRMICEKIGEEANDIVKDVCKAVSFIAYITKESQDPVVAEATADLGDLVGLEDDEDED